MAILSMATFWAGEARSLGGVMVGSTMNGGELWRKDFYHSECPFCKKEMGAQAHDYLFNPTVMACSHCGKMCISSGGTDGFFWIDPDSKIFWLIFDVT